ncbi:THAP domain-containing protein 3 [Latimeria chalumnae]|uniref:THAP domain containing 3 n=1 Tax=Latimeria chalumnae TaxID=7897 RepID=H3B7K4_LATCH|nr:PREDICTED: THAP domain-containing protein 3 [Latimeria chalumnae]|eukprot:XP_005994253.1 PREDICTED: THAP domain-containing protein 3 [Latimeria chalumnae]
MPKSCAALDCRSRYSNKNKELTFHRFPFSKPDLLKEWMENIGRVDFEPKQHTVICSKHFKPECFNKFGNRKNLNHNAVPTIFTSSRLAKESSASETISNQETRTPALEMVLMQEGPLLVVPELAATVEVDDTNLKPLQAAYNLQEPPLSGRASDPDHNYALKSSASLKRRLFLTLEENEKLQKRLKLKTEGLRRITLKLHEVKRELDKLRGGHKPPLTTTKSPHVSDALRNKESSLPVTEGGA